jgi:hypothetical protein
MYIISANRDPEAAAAAWALIKTVCAAVMRYRDRHDGKGPDAVMLSRGAWTTLWIAAEDPDELIQQLKANALNINGVPVRMYEGAGAEYYLAEEESA